jgi:hypothetical protein
MSQSILGPKQLPVPFGNYTPLQWTNSHHHDPLLDLFDYPSSNKEVDCSIVNCCLFVKTKIKIKEAATSY